MAEATVTRIEVSAEIPPAPLILLDQAFLAELQVTAGKVKKVEITDQGSANIAAIVLTELTVHSNRVEQGRTALKAPFIAAGKKIDDVARKLQERIETLKKEVRPKLVAWDEAQKRAAEEAERARQAEIARLEEEKRKADEAARAEADRIAASAPDASMDFEFDESVPAPKTEIEKKIEQVKYAPAAPVQKTAGVRMLTTLRFEVQDVAQLPEQFVTRSANETLIRKTYCQGYQDGAPMPTVPGVRFFVDKTAVSTGGVGI